MPTIPGLESLTDIANFALGQLGSAASIENIVTDTSKEARSLRTNQKTLLKSLLGSYAWNFASVFQRLVITELYSTPEWPFSYLYPQDCVKMIRIWNYRHTDDLESQVYYKKSNDGKKTVLLSEFGPTSILPQNIWAPVQAPNPLPANTWPIPVAQFVQYTENCALMPEQFKQAYGFFWAAYCAPTIPGIGVVDMRKQCLELGSMALKDAASQDQNESKQPTELRSLIERAGRGGGPQSFAVGYNEFPANYTFEGG